MKKHLFEFAVSIIAGVIGSLLCLWLFGII